MKAVWWVMVAALMISVAGIYAQTPDRVQTGQALYAKHGCAKCHQVGGRGNKMFPLDGVAGKMTAADIRNWLVNPAEMEKKLPKPPPLKMSAQKYKFTPQELDALVAYLQTLK
jgi:mono/diheme cytochrome c family protein